MWQLRDDTHLILDGEVRVYRRERSKRWQATFVIDGHTFRISTGNLFIHENPPKTSKCYQARSSLEAPKNPFKNFARDSLIGIG